MGDDRLHTLGVLFFGTLGARRMDSGSATEIESLGLKGGSVRVLAHLASERIEFIDKVALGETSDGRVAGHPCNGVAAGGNEKGAHAHPRGNERGFGPGVASAYDNDIILLIHSLMATIIANYRLSCEYF